MTVPATDYRSRTARSTEGASKLSEAARNRFGAVACGVASIIAFGVLWQSLVDLGVFDPSFIGSPGLVAKAGWKLLSDGSLYGHVKISAARVVVGFALSASLAILLGLAIGSSRTLEAIFQPIVSLIRPLPSLSWIPLSMMWLGIGESQKYAIVFMGTFAPTLVFVVDATRRVEPVMLLAARNLGAGPLRVLWEVTLPAALPSILSALKVTMALAWACIISAEMVGATKGLGFLIWNAKDWANINEVIVGMLTISATVLVLDLIYRSVQGLLMPWHRQGVGA